MGESEQKPVLSVREQLDKKVGDAMKNFKSLFSKLGEEIIKGLKSNKITMTANEEGLKFINVINDKVIKEIKFKELRFPKLDFKMCIGMIPIPRYVKYDDPNDIKSYTSIAEQLTTFGCRSCPDRELCLKLREICVFDMLGQPGEGK